ncbi:hypothetical protein SMICM17S_12142 [Streptomyces microflavus]
MPPPCPMSRPGRSGHPARPGTGEADNPARIGFYSGRLLSVPAAAATVRARAAAPIGAA